jgi:adenylate cyclase
MRWGDELALTAASPEASGADAPVDPFDHDAATSAEIRAEIQRIIGSGEFDASERNRRFLEYVVEETLAGRADRIKAYTIATTVFGRPVDFDPQQDPVVRMEARRLRRSLERFYLTEGKHDALRITLPKGGYVPEFNNGSALAEATPGPASDAPAPGGYLSSILITPFEVEGGQSAFSDREHGLTLQLMIGLCRYPQLSVFGPKSQSRRSSPPGEETLLSSPGADFILAGSEAVAADRLYVKAVLLEAGTRRVLWGQDFERDLQPSGKPCVRDDLANSIVRTLAQPFGVICNHNARKSAGKETPASNMSQCMLLFHRYRRSYRRDLYRPAREGLERAVVLYPDCAEAFACLSHLYADGHRFGFASAESPVMLREQAVALAHKAVDIAPDSSCGYHALGQAYWLQQDVHASLRATWAALALNTNAVEVAADLGLHLALLAEWEQALPLFEIAAAMKPAHAISHLVGLSLYHFVGGRFELALAVAKEIHAPDVILGRVMQAVCLVRLGRREEAGDAVGSILGVDPHYRRGGRDLLADLSGGNIDPDLAARIGEALVDAGLSAAATRSRDAPPLFAVRAPEGDATGSLPPDP